MKKPSVLALAVAVLLASAVTAFAQEVRYNFDKQANFVAVQAPTSGSP